MFGIAPRTSEREALEKTLRDLTAHRLVKFEHRESEGGLIEWRLSAAGARDAGARKFRARG